VELITPAAVVAEEPVFIISTARLIEQTNVNRVVVEVVVLGR
jgi:hypothetical protein